MKMYFFNGTQKVKVVSLLFIHTYFLIFLLNCMSLVMSWTVVIFEETADEPEMVQVVPSTWISGDTCFWPPFSKDKLNGCIKKCLTRDEKWPSFKIRLLRNATYDNYGLAQKKAKKAEVTSDLNSEQEDTQRISKPNRYYLNDTTDESEDDSEITYIKKKEKMKKVLKPPQPPSSFSISNGSSYSKDSFENIRVLENDVGSPKEQCDGAVGEVKAQQKAYSECRCKESVKKQLYVITQLLLELNQKVEYLKNNNIEKRKDENVEYIDLVAGLLTNLPVTTEENLNHLESELKDEKKYKALSINFAKMGGGTLVEFIRRVMSSLIGDDIAIKYSFQGRKEKNSFKELTVSNLVIEATEKSGLSASRKQIEDAIASWLKRAPERKRRGTKQSRQPDGPASAEHN